MTRASSVLSLVVLVLLARPCGATTLKELLLSYDIPLISFSQQELEADVQGAGIHAEPRVVAYQPVGANQVLGSLHVLSYSHSDGRLVRVPALLAGDDICAGAIGGFGSLDGFILLSTSLSPSAECILVLNSALKRTVTLYGFHPVLVSPGLAVITEDLRHFAPVHPERLQLADLRSGDTKELCPPKGDTLRAQFARENSKGMPANEICQRMNDPCDPREFDEEVRDLASDGKGAFAFLVSQSASHAIGANTAPQAGESQNVLYVYRSEDPSGEGPWRYCEQKVQEGAELEKVRQALRLSLKTILVQCPPTLRVVPDMSTADYNPFLAR